LQPDKSRACALPLIERRKGGGTGFQSSSDVKIVTVQVLLSELIVRGIVSKS